jgi:hypothetical protein
MKTPSISIVRILALASALPAFAGDAQVVLSGGMLINQGNTIDLTQKKTGGFALEAGVLFSPENFGPKIMAYGGLARFKAAEATLATPTYSIDSPYFGVEFVYHPWDSLPLNITIGPEFHIWQVDKNEIGSTGPTNQGDQNVKLGLRTGLSYDLGKAWSVSLTYTFSEWRSNPNLWYPETGSSYKEGVNPSRPAYFSLMCSHRF